MARDARDDGSDANPAHVYPHPRRTIVVRNWSGEEQGFGSHAWRADMTNVANNTQAVLNQDSGTG